MITRSLAQSRTVVAFEDTISTGTTTDAAHPMGGVFASLTKFDASCGSLNGDSTGNAIAGLIIDRLGLGRGYNAVQVSSFGAVEIGTSTLDAKFAALYSWLYHSSTTCADDFDRFSTDSEEPRGRAFLLNTTSTLASGYMATSTAIGTFGTFAATATGEARAEHDAFYDLAGAGRYLRPYLFAEAYASSSGGSRFSTIGVNLIFGEADESPRTTTSTGALYKT